MRTYMAIIGTIALLATTAAFGKGWAATPTGRDKITAYGYPAVTETQTTWAAQQQTDQQTPNPMLMSAILEAPVVLTAGHGGGGMHSGGGGMHGGGGSFHGGGGSFHGGPAHGGFHRDFDSHGHGDFHHGHNDFDFRLGFGLGYPYGYGYYPYQYYSPYGYSPYSYYPYGYGYYYPYGYYYGNPTYSYPYFSFSW
jgi:hypothetical protein